MTFPEPPKVSESTIGRGSTRLRFEDVCQDGRLRLEGVWPAIGPILWGQMDVAGALLRVAASGVRAVLTYVELEAEDIPISVRAPAEHVVKWRVGHTVDREGATQRLVFDTWLESSAPRGQPNAPGLPAVGESERIARAFGQHVFTKPMAPPGEHRVLELDDPAFAAIQSQVVPFFDSRPVLALPAGARAIDLEPRPDSAPLAFGLCHTDGNQHVNFLAYPRFAEDAALRRFAELGRDTRLLARRAQIAYRKPCFAGDVFRILVRAYEKDGALGALALFVPDSDLKSRPHCAVRLDFG